MRSVDTDGAISGRFSGMEAEEGWLLVGSFFTDGDVLETAWRLAHLKRIPSVRQRDSTADG
ncbi:hypothetical protein [Paenibacillus gansuensis]|uniref:Uncharacterized protein n=1 Tax=Paenibacillus gansuensis TaxID=306542 RepID=A0ABW5P7V2_9BACL